MEKNFNTDNFEQLLRESTDEFRMYPSRKVWHGIYNDLHPAKRWPSFAVLLLLITSIMYIGITNTDKGGQVNVFAKTGAGVQEGLTNNAASPASIDETPGVTDITSTNTRNSRQNKSIAGEPGNLPRQAVVFIRPAVEDPFTRSKKTVFSNALALVTNKNENANPQYVSAKQVNETNGAIAKNESLNTIQPEKDHASFTQLPAHSGSALIEEISRPSSVEKAGKNLIAIKLTTNNIAASIYQPAKDESGWMEDYAFHNLKSRAKWKGRMAYTLYVTPSVGYRTLNKNSDYSLPPANALLANPYNAGTTTYALNHSSAVNLEIGTGLIYKMSNTLRLKAGMQLNYTNYSVNAQELNHPTFTTLMLTNTFTNTPVLSTRSTTIANTPGPASKYLNNNTYQVSLPLGADIKVAGNDKLKLYFGGTLQPTLVLGGQSYLISSDMKNYVADQNFMRKYNLNAGVETFVTYKTKSGVILNAGPQFRYQFFSTYNKTYTYDEKLYNIGVKLGMTKNF